MLQISEEKVFFIIVKAREFDVKEPANEENYGSNSTDDAMISILESHADDAVEEEMTSFISALTVDEQIDLVALAWLGREDFDQSDWPDMRALATEAHNEHTAKYLLGMPMLADHLEEGLSQTGHSVEEFEFNRL